jgi:RNA polymerase sigma-70 factor (ECF subfamily)
MPSGKVITAGEDDALIVRRVLKGDRAAFELLVRRYQGGLFRFLYHLLGGDRSRAEEVAQEAFLKVFSHLGRYDQSKKFSTWLYAIARNVAIDEMKKARPIPFSALADPAEGSSWIEDRVREERTPALICAENEEQLSITRALAELPPEYRDVVVLRYFEGLSYVEIAEILGQPVTTVKIRLFRAKKRLLALLGDDAGGPPGSAP